MKTVLILESLGPFSYVGTNKVKAIVCGEFGSRIVSGQLLALWNAFWAVSDPPGVTHDRGFLDTSEPGEPAYIVVRGAESFTLEDFAEVIRGLISLEVVTQESPDV